VAFTLSAFILTLASRVRPDALCGTAIQLCLTFYLGGKFLLYVYICERLRSIRSQVVDRCADILWQRCFWALLIIFGQVAIVLFFYPIDTARFGYCTIGVPTFVIVPILVFDIGCNITASWIFYVQGGKVASLISPEIRRSFEIKRNADGKWRLENASDATGSIALMAFIIHKTFVVSIAILFSTITNLVLLLYYNGREHGWMCFLMCTYLLTIFSYFES
jgi:hypothetical protein